MYGCVDLFQVCITVLQVFFPFQVLWKAPPVCSHCSTGVDAILEQVHEECWASEKVVHKDMVVLPHKRLCQGPHHRSPKTKLRCSVASLPLVHLKLAEVAIVAVSPDPHLYPSLDWLLWHVLLEGCPTLTFDHSLICCTFTVWVVALPEHPAAVVNNRSHLPSLS